ncbi:MAG: GGDEF domain-containing protein [Phascolarctobacterium sp.]|nr:GGDEF domain-containing protein [Phascolarctobacterium sp.]
MNKILRNRLYIVIFGFALFSLVLNFFVQRHIARGYFHDSSVAIFNEIEHILDSNEAVIEKMKLNFKENGRLRARIAAEFIEHDRSSIGSVERLKKLASMLKIDEINIFDENGVIISGTEPKYIGYNVNSGEQIAFFKDMLLDKNIELAQDFMPNTATGEMMQYAAVWMPCKEHFVQIGRRPPWLTEVLSHTELSQIFHNIVLDTNANILAMNIKTNEIMASTDENLIGQNISVLGIEPDSFEELESGMNCTLNAEEYFVVMDSMVLSGQMKLAKLIKTSDLYSKVNFNAFILMCYLALGATVIIMAISKYLKYYVINDLEAVNEDLNEITNGNLNTRVNVNATPEFVELSKHINTMVDSLKENTRRAFEMCDKLNVPIGLYEYRNGMVRVAQTGNLAAILCLDGKEHFAVFANRNLFEEKLEQIKKNLVDESHRVYRLPWAERYIRLEQTEYPDATIGVIMDVTDSFMEMSVMARERDTDVMTGLLNRRSFFERLESLFKKPEVLGCAGMYFIDANKLKYVNDAFGHGAGDQYLCAIADVIRNWGVANKVCCRFGGDEFAVFVYGAKSKEELHNAFDEVMYTMSNTKIEVEGEQIRLSFTVGASFYPEHSSDYHALLAMADENMCENKGMGITNRSMLR